MNIYRIYRHFVSPVCLRGKCDDHTERKASWAELFFDLVFVIAITAVATILYNQLSSWRIIQVVILLSMLWTAWLATTFYANRFDTDDPLHRLANILQMVCICILALNIPSAFSANPSYFIVTYCFLRGVLLLLYLRVAVVMPEIRSTVVRILSYLTLIILAWLSSLALPIDIRSYFWLFIIIIDLLMPLFLRHSLSHSQAQLTQSHLAERFGLFILIVLGESIAGLVHGMVQLNTTLQAPEILIIGLLFIFSLWWLYFESMNTHPFADNFTAGLIWEYLHYLLIIGIILLAAGLYHCVISPIANSQALMVLGTATAFVFFLLAGLNALSLLRQNISLHKITVLIACGAGALLSEIAIPYISSFVYLLFLMTLGVLAVTEQILLR